VLSKKELKLLAYTFEGERDVLRGKLGGYRASQEKGGGIPSKKIRL